MRTSQITRLETDRYYLRPLQVDDATPRYLSWFSNEGAEFIHSAEQMKELDNLRVYILEKANADDVQFFGIFQKDTDLHVGNIKYEPIDLSRKFAVMGILIGDADHRGVGAAAEVIAASASHLNEHYAIENIVLGVEKSNTPAIQAYRKIGFVEKENEFLKFDDPEYLSMIWAI